jgi:chemotaxis protein CheD
MNDRLRPLVEIASVKFVQNQPPTLRKPPTATNSRLIVDVGHFLVSNDPEAELITFALGSCVAVILHDRSRLVGGMIHYRLPVSSVDPEKGRLQPATFADTGLQALFRKMCGTDCNKRDIVVKLAGGSSMNGDSQHFDIGNRNILIARRILWQHRLLIAAESVGGSIPRTVYLNVGNGRCYIRTPNEEFEL